MEEIERRLERAAEHVRRLGYFPAYVSLHGSQNYGLALECADYRSDYDYKCIVLPSLRSLAEDEKPASLTVVFEEGQIDIKDARMFAELVCRMNPSYLECLLTPHYAAHDGCGEITAMRENLPTLFKERGADFARVCVKSFEEKAKRMCHVSPAQAERIARFGYDGKQAHHMYRLLVMLRGFDKSGVMQLAVPEGEKPLLLELKRNLIPLENVRLMIEAWHSEIQEIEKRLAQRYGKSVKNAAKQIQALARQAVYEHCRSEVLHDGNTSD